MTPQQTAFQLAFEPPRFLSYQEIEQRADRIQALVPDLTSWDPAGRGKRAQPAHFLLDLLQCAGLGRSGENDEGYPARGSWGPTSFYLALAAELSKRAFPSELLVIDGRSPLPQGVELGADEGFFQLAAPEGDMLDALFNHWMVSGSQPHSTEDLRVLALNLLSNVTLTPEQGARGVRLLLQENLCLLGSMECFGENHTLDLTQALIHATPLFDPAQLSLTAAEKEGIKRFSARLWNELESSFAFAEARALGAEISDAAPAARKRM